jgi:predicted enzyme related to lactoylglutathione lyase
VIAIGNITFACAEPVQLAEFWAAVLGYAPVEVPADVEAAFEAAIERGEVDPTGWAMLVHPEGVGPRLLFQRRSKTATESIPIHLDLNADDPEGEVERLLTLGATVVEKKTETTAGFTQAWTVMRDPEGNGFCVQ